MTNDKQQLFDDWAAQYDTDVTNEEEFPFIGYDRVLNLIVQEAALNPSLEVLDLGTGTGNLAARLLTSGCTVWGVDFSPEMLTLAREKMPDMKLIQANLLDDWSEAVDQRFDRITAAYVLHEFEPAVKIAFLQRLVDNYLSPGGRIIIGDIAFPSAEIREQARPQWREDWDETEYYWAADEVAAPLEEAGLHTRYQQVSSCAGVLVVTAG